MIGSGGGSGRVALDLARSRLASRNDGNLASRPDIHYKAGIPERRLRRARCQFASRATLAGFRPSRRDFPDRAHTLAAGRKQP